MCDQLSTPNPNQSIDPSLDEIGIFCILASFAPPVKIPPATPTPFIRGLDPRTPLIKGGRGDPRKGLGGQGKFCCVLMPTIPPAAPTPLKRGLNFRTPLFKGGRGDLLTDIFLKDAVAVGVAEFAEGFRFDLANPLTGDIEDLADFFKGFHPAIIETIA